MRLFGERSVEAVAQLRYERSGGERGALGDDSAAVRRRLEGDAREDLDAAVGALDLNQLMQNAAQALADAYDEPLEDWHRERAPLVLAALGLIGSRDRSR